MSFFAIFVVPSSLNKDAPADCNIIVSKSHSPAVVVNNGFPVFSSTTLPFSTHSSQVISVKSSKVIPASCKISVLPGANSEKSIFFSEISVNISG